jgi:arylsulfatase A-like enzyme
MTSLQTSVMGGVKGADNPVPSNVRTMAEHTHAAGYQTGVFTANPNAGRLGGLERGVDSFQEGWEEFSYWDGLGNWNRSSSYLHESFWIWREAYPGKPYWVHFQTVDIHGDFPAPAPFGGLYVSPEEVGLWEEWTGHFREQGLHWNTHPGAFEELGIDRVGFFALMQGMYDEALALNDDQIGRLVERLKATGDWENTLLVIASDHSIAAAAGDLRFFMQDSLPPHWAMRNPYLRPSISRVPLMFIWPGHIPRGQRFSEPVVSMIDVLPTILDLAGLPLPDIVQGRSLAPLLLGTGGVESRPVILDEFHADPETGELHGILEVIDGRWGASLEVNPWPPGQGQPDRWRRPVPFLLYDLWTDPYCFHSLHEERPDLAEKYTAFLEDQWEAHQALGQYFTAAEEVVLTAQQLEMLRTLGYIR